MKFVIAPDSFKGSLTAVQAADIMKDAVLAVVKESETEILPMADGGEGTLDCLLASDGKRIQVRCTGPLGSVMETSYGLLDDRKAIIECANIAGLTQVPLNERNPDHLTSYGIGEVMKDALDRGCTSFIIGLGGSATNDGGLGMLQALGMKAWDEDGNEIGPFGRDLLKVASINLEGLDKRLEGVRIAVACDVNNPLCGSRGASAVYGPQKGANPQQVKEYDEALQLYSELIRSEIGRDYKDVPGAGAAGGLGFALLTLGAELSSGAELVAEAIQLKDHLRHADFILTGEGQSDEQTLYGKAPGYVADLAALYQVPAILISGSLIGDLELLRGKFTGCFSIIRQPMSLEDCMKHADKLLFEQTKQVVHLIYSLGYWK